MQQDFTQAHILIVDDKKANVVILENLLKHAGIKKISSTTDPRQVTPLIKQQEPDLILLDLTMPYLNGFEVMDELKQVLPTNSYLPVIVLTASEDPEARYRALSEGAMDFLNKPFDKIEVIKRAQNLLHTRFLHKKQQNYNVILEEAVQKRTNELAFTNKALAKSNQALEDANLEILSRLAKAAEYHDDDSEQHTFRVGQLSYFTTLQLGLSSSFADLILRAARLHDIGKISIPEKILLKPGKLVAEEWTIMRTHTTVGAEVLSGSDSPLIRMAETIALTHHECWNGNGYPNNLQGENIPIEGRIVAVADTYDALTHKRPYQQPWSQEQTIKFLLEEKNLSFDAKVVDAFLRANDELQKHKTFLVDSKSTVKSYRELYLYSK